MTRTIVVAVIVLATSPAAAEGWKVTREVRAGSMPWSVTVSADGARLWVSMVGLRNRDNVWRYDAATLEVEAKSSFRGHAVESRLMGDGARLVVTNSRVDRLMILDAETLSVDRALDVSSIPKDMRLSRDESTAYLANWGAGSLSIVDLASGKVTDVRTGRHSRGVALAPDESEAYVMSFGARQVVVVDLEARKVAARIRACVNPRHGAVVDDLLLVTCYGQRHVLVIDRAKREVVRTLRVGRAPKTIAVSPDRRTAVTANERGNSASFIDLDTWQVDTVSLPAKQPCGAAWAPDGKRVYITARGSHELLELARQ